jgi:hypothetical protein
MDEMVDGWMDGWMDEWVAVNNFHSYLCRNTVANVDSACGAS